MAIHGTADPVFNYDGNTVNHDPYFSEGICWGY